MKNKKRLGKIWLWTGLALAGICYFPLIGAFFEQDEWSAFGRYFASKSILADSFTLYRTHYAPLSNLMFNIQAKLFGIDFGPFAIWSILGHLFVVILAYLVFWKVFKDKLYALLATLIFALGAPGYQATTWIAASTGTHWASFFGLLAIYISLIWAEKNHPRGWLVYFFGVSASILISLLFKEITIALFAVIPVTFYLYGDRIFSRKYFSLGILAVGAVYLLFRIAIIWYSPVVTKGNDLVTQTQSIEEVGLNTVILPVNTLIQSVIPPRQINNAIEIICDRVLPEGLASEGEIILGGSILAFLLFSCLVMRIWRIHNGRMIGRGIIYGYIFVIINSFVYAFSPGRTGRMVFVDSRNLYFPSVGTAIILTSIIYVIAKRRKLLAAAVALVFVGVNVFWLEKEIGAAVEKGEVRERILITMREEHPDLPDKAIIYTESDVSYYGLDEGERILPFQSGFGHTALVWYTQTENYPKEFLDVRERFLWGITEEGYKEAEGRGFGYFRDFEKMVQALDTNNLGEGAVIAYRYDSEERKVYDITGEVRGRIRGYRVKKKEVERGELIYLPSANAVDFGKAIDGKRETWWNSKVAYMFPQEIAVDLGKERKVAEIRIDSNGNKDQDKVGYRVSRSVDGEEWSEVFYSKRHPPDQRGLAKIYIDPEPGRYLKIEQVGSHQHADWVIYELTIYEAV